MGSLQDKPDYCTDSLTVKSGLTKESGGDKGSWAVLQLKTASGALYRTSLADERCFRFLVQQIEGDQLAEIRYSDLFMQEWMMSSANIGEWIKSRVLQNLNSL